MLYDLAVIGGGAGGLAAARTAAQCGAKVVMINPGPPGGDCTFWGCVPSKTLIERANAGTSFADATQQVKDVVAEIAASESPDVMSREGIDFIDAEAAFTSPSSVAADGQTISAKNFVIATGSSPIVPKVNGAEHCLTNETIFDLDALPESLTVIGGGAIGCELAQAFAKFGSRVTLIEQQSRLLPEEEIEASQIIRAALEADGVSVKTNTTLTEITATAPSADQSSINQSSSDQSQPRLTATITQAGTIQQQTHIQSSHILSAVGRRPNTHNLGLETAGVELTPNGAIDTQPHMQTSVAHIYAAGDVTGLAGFSHAADMMGRIAAGQALRSALAGKIIRRKFNPLKVPYAIFCNPELARVGVAEHQAPAGSRVAYLPLTHDDRSRTAGRTEGYVKLIAAPRQLTRHKLGGKLIGATIVAPRAGEMIHEPALALTAKLILARLALLPHAYPTYSSAIQKAAAQFFIEIEGLSWREANTGADAASD